MCVRQRERKSEMESQGRQVERLKVVKNGVRRVEMERKELMLDWLSRWSVNVLVCANACGMNVLRKKSTERGFTVGVSKVASFRPCLAVIYLSSDMYIAEAALIAVIQPQ